MTSLRISSRSALIRSRIPLRSTSRLYSTAAPTSDRVPTNEPSPPAPAPNISSTNTTPVSSGGLRDAPMVESVESGEKQRQTQAPNRTEVWSRSQAKRDEAMSGPRFEQTMMHMQPQPEAAISLIHKQPVRWTKNRVVSCDGGGGPLGHPRIFINVDKPQICWCTYCGLPFAHEHHRSMLKSLPSTTYPLEPVGEPAEVPQLQRVSDEAYGHR